MTCILAHRLDALQATLSVKHRLIAASLLRIALGLIVLMIYAQHLYQRAFLWGNAGAVPFDAFARMMREQHNFSLYELSSSPLYADILFYLGMAVTIAFVLGYKTRLATVAFFIVTWSLYQRNAWVLDGGDNLLYLVAFFLMFADCGAYFSVDRALGRRRVRQSAFMALLHNVAITAIVIQVCLLYFTSVLYKIQGHMWQDGTALYYVLRTAEFNLSPLGRMLYSNAYLMTLLVYATLAFQMAFPFLIWNPKTKWLMTLGACTFHLSIAYFMGLVWFSLVMMSVEFIIYTDANYRRLATWMRTAWSALRTKLRRMGTGPLLQQYRLSVFYDGACPLCIATMRGVVDALDLTGLIDPVSFRDPSFVPPAGVQPVALEHRMHVRTGDGRVLSGIQAVAAIVNRVPLLWWAAPFIWLATRAGVGDRLYDYIATRRMGIPVGQCSGGACALPVVRKDCA